MNPERGRCSPGADKVLARLNIFWPDRPQIVPAGPETAAFDMDMLPQSHMLGRARPSLGSLACGKYRGFGGRARQVADLGFPIPPRLPAQKHAAPEVHRGPRVLVHRLGQKLVSWTPVELWSPMLLEADHWPLPASTVLDTW